MNIHVARVNELGFSPADFVAAKERERKINEMASDLVAGALGPLDLSSDPDVVFYLIDNVRWKWPDVRDHLTAALDVARQTIAAAAEGLR